MLTSRTGQGIIPSDQQQMRSEERQLQQPTINIELLSSDGESDENSASSSLPPCSAPVSPAFKSKRNSTASKKILEKFLKASAGADSVREAVELHQMMMESDSDSSSTGSGFGQLWGLSRGEENIDGSDNAEYDSSTEEYGIKNESDFDSDSSIEIVNPSCLSPVGRGMNSRHLSARQRRLEAARSKISASRLYDSSADHHDNDSKDGDMNIIREDQDDDCAFRDGNGILPGKETSETNSHSSALVPTETEESNNISAKTFATSAEVQFPASQLPNTASTKLTSEKSRSDIENIELRNKSNATGSNIVDINGINANTTNDDSPRLPDEDMKMNANVNQSNDKISSEVKDMPRRSRITAKKSSKKRTKFNPTTESDLFDNLFCNGKDFFAWAGITDPHDFLKRNKDFALQVNLWRKDRNLPLFNDTIGYIKKLRRQVRDNMKNFASRAKKHGHHTKASIGAPKNLHAINKSKKKRNKKTIYSSMKDLPMEGGDFMNFMEIKNIEDVFKRKGLHKHVNEWRKSKKLPLIEDERSCIANWRKWIRQNIQYRAVDVNTKDDTPDEIDFSNCMEVVSSLSKRFLNSETGLAVYQFAVYDTLSTDIIYEFRVEAKPSLIPNAGNGAFLTFLGAREASCPIVESDTALEVETIQPLVSKDIEGYHMGIKVVGEHLEGSNKRAQYPPPTSLPPIHGSPERRAICDGKSPWTLQPEGESLLSRYVESSEILFSTNQIGCSVIELGRYGPFRRSDRKFQLHYDLKNFIFSNEVSEWGFDVIEDFNGKEQVADVTDDTTGMPHHVAKHNIAMHVNETGGDPGLKQTVWSGQVFDREVNYYFKTEKPMKKGETIELLISYFGTYDEIRERKGYGERNKRGDILGDDHFPTLLERNFVERYDMVEVVYEVERLTDLYLLSEFLEKIRGKLARIIETFVRKLQFSSEGIHVPYAQQIIALRRLNWLKPFFLKKIESLQKKVNSSRKPSDAAIGTPILQQCAANARCLEWASWPILMDLLEKHPNLVDGKGINVRSKFREEVTEDVCYGVSSSLRCPCNESIWCDVASKLTRDLCYIIARDRWNYSKREHPSNLAESLVQKSVNASEAIRNPKSANILNFDTSVWKRYALNNRAGIAKEPRGTKCLMLLANDCKKPEKRSPVPLILKDTSAIDQTHILNSIHKEWYLVRQILFVADTFAKSYLADDKSYSFESLRQKLGVSSEASTLFLKRDIELDLESSFFYGKEFESIYSTGNKLYPNNNISNRKRSMGTALKTANKQPRIFKTPVRKLLFWDVLIKRLKELGWNVVNGNRSNDWYLFPPGLARGMGLKPRIDFFDSAPLVINCLKTNPKYCNSPAIKSIMKEYVQCQIEFEKMKSSKSNELKTLSNTKIVEYLMKKASQLENDSATTASNTQNNGVATIKLVFRSEQLGLLLYVINGQVVLKDVQNPEFKTKINSGDAMIAVGENSTRNKSLADACEIIRRSSRPVTITFERKI